MPSNAEKPTTLKDTKVPKYNDTKMPKPQDLPIPSVPRTAMLLGMDFEKRTYHWEGPLGLPFETLPGNLFGGLKGWTRLVALDARGCTLLPEVRGDEPNFYLLNPNAEEYRLVEGCDTLFQVVDKRDGSQVMKIPRNRLLTARENPDAPMEMMAVKRSPYALAAFR